MIESEFMNQTTLVSRHLLLPLYLNRHDIIVMRVKDDVFMNSLYYFIEDEAEVTIVVNDKNMSLVNKHRHIGRIVLCIENPKFIGNFVSELNNVLLASTEVYNNSFYELSDSQGGKSEVFIVIEKGRTKIKSENQCKKFYSNNIDLISRSYNQTFNCSIVEQKLYAITHTSDRSATLKFSRFLDVECLCVKIRVFQKIDLKQIINYIKNQLIAYLNEYKHDTMLIRLDKYVYLAEFNVYMSFSCNRPLKYLHFDNLKDKTKTKILNFVKQPENYIITREEGFGVSFTYLSHQPYEILANRLLANIKMPNTVYYGCLILGEQLSGKTQTLTNLLPFTSIPYTIISIKKIVANYVTINFNELKASIELAISKNLYKSKFILCIEDIQYILNDIDPSDPNTQTAGTLRSYMLRWGN